MRNTIAEIRLNIQEVGSTLLSKIRVPGHIRVAIPTMCVGMLVVAALMMLLMACGCVPNGKGEDGDGGDVADGDEEEKESLVRGGSSDE